MIETLAALVKQGIITASMAANQAQMTEEEFESKAGLIH